MKKILSYFMFLAICFILYTPVYGGSFNTNSYNVNIDVKKNGSLHIEENIKVDFLQPSHGIFRYIPYEGKPRFKVDNKLYSSKAIIHIKNVEVKDEDFSTNTENGNYIIKIGSKDKMISGEKNYKISYDIDLINNIYKDFDIFYYNVLPTDWRSNISNANINITFPKEINPKGFQIYKGKFGNGEIYNNKIAYTHKTVKFTLTDLKIGEGATAFMVLPKNYYVNPLTTTKYNIVFIVIATILSISFIILYLIYGKGDKLIKTVEFKPPKDVDPLIADFCVSAKITNDDIIAVLMYLANKGYIAIEQIKDINLKDKLDLKITQLKAPDIKIKSYIRGIYDRLFNNKSVTFDDNGNKMVLFSKLSDDFWSSATKLLSAANTYCYSYNRKNYNKKTRIFKTFSIIFAGIYLVLNFIILSNIYTEDSAIGMIVLPIFIIATLYINIGFAKRTKYTKIRLIIKSLVYWLVSAFLIWLLGKIYLTILGNEILGITILLPAVILVFFGAVSRKYTNEGRDFYGRLLGFRDYIEVAELDRIEKLTLDNPNYFFDILPYAMVFGLTEIWVNKFKGIKIQNPNWIYGDFDILYMVSWYHFMNTTSSTKINQMNIKNASKGINDVSSSSFGGGGIGGFTGGGFGGGGGGSW